jgi:phosphocarrier protein HPr
MLSPGVMSMAERRVTVTTEVGIQARPATVFVDLAAESASEVTLAKTGEDPVDAKSILAVLVLDVRQGDAVTIASDDADIVDRLADLVSSGGLEDRADESDDTDDAEFGTVD